MQRTHRTSLAERFEEIGREIGALLIVFAPLDAAFSDSEFRWRWMLIFLLLGIFFIGIALATEHRSRNDI